MLMLVKNSPKGRQKRVITLGSNVIGTSHFARITESLMIKMMKYT